MRHRTGFNPLSCMAAHRRALRRNMVTSLFKFERITTTKPKAAEVRRAAERLITRSKSDSVHNRRQVARFIWDKAVLHKLFADIGPRMREREGGYTRILKLGLRQGDAAHVVVFELVDYTFEKSLKKRARTDSVPARKGAGKKDASRVSGTVPDGQSQKIGKKKE